ncbi:hypothetical protein ACFOSC_19615 [Streptantibioticus rubrisoli]|nr:hypothetical protein [Streptantibioticus rubrisoli]
MTAVMVEIAPLRPAEADEEIVLLDDLEVFGESAMPGCGDDNPYN